MRGQRWWSGVDGGMELSDSAFIWRDVVGKRWVKCVAWQVLISSVLWLLSEVVLNIVSRPFVALQDIAVGRPFLWAGLRFMAFQAALGVFILGQTFISEPEERDAASLRDLALGLLYTLVKFVMRRSQTAASVELSTRIRTTLDFLMFGSMCAFSGFLAFTSFLSAAQLSFRRSTILQDGSRGAVLGLMYAGLQFHRGKLTLHFPLIQRGLFFALKMGVPTALSRSLTLALTLIPLGEALAFAVIPSASAGADARRLEGRQFSSSFSSVLGREWLYATGAFFVALSWEIAHHMVRVVLTEQHVFAPPLGSSAEETESTDLLLTVLEDPETGSLVRYHAFHDLCITAETNVETWRRAAFFEETGDSYRRLIATCLRMLDSLTLKLAQHQYLEGSQAGKGNGKGLGFLNYQGPQTLGADCQSQGVRNLNENSSNPFQDFQLCLWSARTVAALTSCSRFEDRHGIAQLHGFNVHVVSSLLSCLLVTEVFLGTRPNASGVNFEPNSLQWTVFSGGRDFVELDDNWRQSRPVRKRAAMQDKAYAMADVLRTSLYQIVSAFGGGIMKGGSLTGLWSMTERGFWNQKKPLFGDQEAHLRKLRMFVEYRA